MRETKTFHFAELKIAGEEGNAGSFEGRASTFGAVDSYGDTIVPGAYVATIPQFLARGFIGWGHDWADPIGYVTAAEERPDGLYITGQFHSDADAQKYRRRAAERFAAGKFMGLSIGYEAEAWEMRQVDTPVRTAWGEFTDKVRALTKIRLFEVSLVTVPAEENSGLTAIKGHGIPFEEHAARVAAALHTDTESVKELLTRVRTGSEQRATKEGRAISSARRERMAGVRDALRSGADEIDALLTETAPPEKALGADPAELRREFLKLQRTRFRALAGAH
jgi:HK97 family phage prohead protease